MKKTNYIKLLWITFIGISLTACSGSQPRKHNPNAMFEKFDEDRDGFVDYAEYSAVNYARLIRADKDEDDRVSIQESEQTFIGKRFPNKMKQWFKSTDLDNNSFISKLEMDEKSKKDFLKKDVNKDKLLTKVEMRDYRNAQKFNYIDANKDGTISKQEYLKMKAPFSK